MPKRSSKVMKSAMSLAGVLEVGEGVDDGDVGVRGHLGDGFVRVGAENDDLHPAL